MGNNSGIGVSSSSEGVCSGDFHAYPKTYAGDPQYAAEYFSHCLCGKKKKVTTVEEVDVKSAQLTEATQERKESTRE